MDPNSCTSSSREALKSLTVISVLVIKEKNAFESQNQVVVQTSKVKLGGHCGYAFSTFWDHWELEFSELYQTQMLPVILKAAQHRELNSVLCDNLPGWDGVWDGMVITVSRWHFCLPSKASISTITTLPNGLCTWAGEPVSTGARTLTVKLWATLLKNAYLSFQGNDFNAPLKWHGPSCLLSVQFSSVQSLSCVWLLVTPWTAAHQASLPITNTLGM